MIGNTLVGTSHLARAKTFWNTLLAPLGMERIMEFERMCAWGRGFDQAAFGVITPLNGQPATVANGSMVSFQCSTREQVDAMHRTAIELGGSDEGAPGARGPSGEFYAAYFRDLDGHKFLAYARG